MDNESVVLGSGKLYCVPYVAGEELPENSAIETKENMLGLISGGASLVYKPTYYTAKDDLGIAVKTILTDETVTLKSGIMTWCGDTLNKICETARVELSEDKKTRTVKIGGIGNADGKKYIIRFVHEDAVDGNLRVTIVGNNQAGFTMNFAAKKETVIDATFSATSMDDAGTLIHYEEDVTQTAETTTADQTTNS